MYCKWLTSSYVYITIYFKTFILWENKTMGGTSEDSKNVFTDTFKNHKSKCITPSFQCLSFRIILPEICNTFFFSFGKSDRYNIKNLTCCYLAEGGGIILLFCNKITFFVYKARICFPCSIDKKDRIVFISLALHSLFHFLFLSLFTFFSF